LRKGREEKRSDRNSNNFLGINIHLS